MKSRYIALCITWAVTAEAYVLQPRFSRRMADHKLNLHSRNAQHNANRRMHRPLAMCTPESEAVGAALGMKAMTASPATVLAPGCPSCEADWLAKSKETEAAETLRLTDIRQTALPTYVKEIWDYSQHMNDTQRQELALTPDLELRRFIIDSSTPPTLLMEHIYNETMQRVPYEQACYICGPEQAMLLRTLVALASPKTCLDIGCFTGYASSAILDAIPKHAELICLDVEPEWTKFAAELFESSSRRNVQFRTAPASESLAALEAEGRMFDVICLDADKPMHGEYYNTSLRLLRPGGLMVMFGMILFPTVEDQQAMEKLHELLPNDTRIDTAQLPVGCGIQMIIKKDIEGQSATPRVYQTMAADGSTIGVAQLPPLEGEAAMQAFRRFQLQSELSAVERLIDASGVPLGGAASNGPGSEALSSAGLVALAAARKAAQEAAAAAEAEAAAQ
mmetsp:Transcript_16845/g.27945  ORF Transcript_16845/g.27945 Transcript_16845/m.27945 type:complete len:450 (+) Transcript_16845:77-1426(+)